MFSVTVIFLYAGKHMALFKNIIFELALVVENGRGNTSPEKDNSRSDRRRCDVRRHIITISLYHAPLYGMPELFPSGMLLVKTPLAGAGPFSAHL